VDRNPQSGSNQTANSDQPANNSNQDHESSQSTTTPTPAPATSNTDKNPAEQQEPEHAKDKTEDPTASEQIVAQSLAGLPTTPKNTPAPVSASAEVTATPETSADAAKTGNAQAANPAQEKAANQQQKVAPTDAQAQANGDSDTNSQKQSGKTSIAIVAPTVNNSTTQETVAKPQAGDKVDPVKKEDKDEQPTDNSRQLSDIKLSGDDKSQPQPAQVKHDQTPAADASQLTLDASTTVSPTVDGTNLQAAVATPIVAPATNASPIVDQPGQTQSNNSSATTAITGAQTRSRLPAQALAPEANTSVRHAPLEVDTTRLISRVVRAFSAAQERDGEVRLRLSPPELGSLRLDVRVENGALTAHLQTETDSARVAIIDNLPTLRDRLAEQGVRIERFDVDLMQRQSGGMPDQPGGRQSDMPEAPLRVPAPTQSTATTAPPLTSPSQAQGNASGLNVVI
jgi:flagellar hook-length control protein FliK